MKISILADRFLTELDNKEKYNICDVIRIARGWCHKTPIEDCIRAACGACFMKCIESRNGTVSDMVQEVLENPSILIAKDKKAYQDWTGFIKIDESRHAIYVKHAFFTIEGSRIAWLSGELRNRHGLFSNLYIIKRNKEN